MFLVFSLLPGVGRARYHRLYLWIVHLPRGDTDVDARLFIDHCYVSFIRVLIFLRLVSTTKSFYSEILLIYGIQLVKIVFVSRTVYSVMFV